ncbi:Protein-S-isoprenylcysteine O-methyltransferase Ste14 [Nannocystis exedens]|uniref:methanethiol S-methyltransferase n=1 Tax=Nannocystis exedens TaxID=54 RepID=A0A1I1YT39_9BACT|nr:methanethiol S-methyltransferase [Nannocystis exedens]PCC70158.1 membrane protein [Nannocystis exedens]SFE22677.1 Protein-S-isoprenylcysteine O-methyltransferase Ste14 [Nannocystis exedens]
MGRVFVLVHGVVSYIVVLAVFAYFAGFVAGVCVPKTIDDGPVGPWPRALMIDLALLGGFALQHSVMARPWFKRMWTVFVPESAERSTYVLLASLQLALTMWVWHPLPTPIWQLGDGLLAAIVHGLAAIGWGLVLVSTFAVDHFHLFGLRQAVGHWLGRPAREPEFRVRGPYRLVRHPLMLGFLLAFWAAPTMSVGHLAFALAMTLYVLVALELEERDLRAQHGAHYDGYRARIPRLNPFARR